MVLQVLSLFLPLFVAIEGRSMKENYSKEPFELNDFLYRTLKSRSFNGTWLTGDSFYYVHSSNFYNVYNQSTKESTPFLNKAILSGYSGSTFTVSPGQRYILISYNVSSVFRHSTTARYAIYDIKNKVYYDIAHKKSIQLAQWSPNGHSLVYVYQNNIYYLRSPSAKPKRVTTSGHELYYYNGVPDWVYEEEILGSGSAIWFSPTGNQIAFACFDDRNVDEYLYLMYGKPGKTSGYDLEYLYPREVKIRYPKVNRTNPSVKTYIADLETEEEEIEVVEIDAIPKRFQEDNYVFYGITWITDDEIAIFYTNRVQNKGELVRCYKDGSCQTENIYKEEKGWLKVFVPIYGKSGTQRLEILPQPENEDHFFHIVLTEVTSGTSSRLTKGRFDVNTIYGWDEANNFVYFAGSRENFPSQRQVYAVSTETKQVKCLTCGMKTPEGSCLYASASFSLDFSRYAKICRGPGPELIEIHNTRNESDVVVWEDNHSLRAKLALKSLPVIKNIKLPIGTSGFTANVRMFLPPRLNENGTKKYPAIVKVYAGPGSNIIKDVYSSDFMQYITTNREYIYIYVDGRGSGNDGQNKRFQMYRRLGTVEIEDQIVAIKYLQQTYPYVDANKTAIWGWSYGGFSSLWALLKDTEKVFKCGLSVAPVIDFRLYDSIYTERYMGLPREDDNYLGYNNTDVTRKLEALRGKLFFLIHGNADDNVHYQQSMVLSKALELADIQFMQQSYPDENHRLKNVYPHLYHTIDRFFARCFDLPDPPIKQFKRHDV